MLNATIRRLRWWGLGAAGLAAAAGAAWMLSLPAQPVVTEQSPPPRAEADAMLQELQPRQERPVIAIEAITGREKAEAVGRDIGLPEWDARPDSGAYAITRPFALSVLANTLAFWSHEDLGIELRPGVDEVSLALVADAWSRTYRSRAYTFSSRAGAQTSRNGVAIVPDRVASSWPETDQIPAFDDRPPAGALEQALDGIRARYGPGTAHVVTTQLEYPGTRS